MIGGSSPGKGREFFSSPLCPGPSQLPIIWVSGALSVWVKRPGREADHSPPSSAWVNNAWRYTSAPQYVFMAWCSVEAQRELVSGLMCWYYFSSLKVWLLLNAENSFGNGVDGHFGSDDDCFFFLRAVSFTENVALLKSKRLAQSLQQFRAYNLHCDVCRMYNCSWLTDFKVGQRTGEV
jgi:hypothetical protein